MKLSEAELLKYASAASQCGMQITPSLHFKLSAENIGKEQSMNVTSLAAQIKQLLSKEKVTLHEALDHLSYVTGSRVSPSDITRIGGEGRHALHAAALAYLQDFVVKPDSAPIAHFNFDFSKYTQDSATKTILEEALQKAIEKENVATVVESDMNTDFGHDLVEESNEDDEDFDEGEDYDQESDEESASDEDDEDDDFTSDADEGDESEVEYEDADDDEADTDDYGDHGLDDDHDSDEEIFQHVETNDYLSGPFMAVEDAIPFAIKTRLALVVDFSVVCPREVLKDLRRVETDDGVIDFYNAFSAPAENFEGGYALLGLDSTVEILQKFNDSNTIYIGSQDTLLPAAATTAANIAMCIERTFALMSGIDSSDDTVNSVHTEHNLFDVSSEVSADVDTDIPEIVITFFLAVRSQNVTSLDKLNRAKSRINQLLLEKEAHSVPVEIYAAVNASTLLNNDPVRLVARSLDMMTEIQLNELIESRLDALDQDFKAILDSSDPWDEEEGDDDLATFVDDGDDEEEDESEEDIFPLASLESSALSKYLPNDTSMVAHIVSLNTGYDDEDEEDYEDEA